MSIGCQEPEEVFPDWARDFGRAAPLELEIGPGRGAVALDHAARHPDIDLVLIETRRSDCELIRARAQKRGLRNVMVLQGDARLLVPRIFPLRSLAALHVQFPDPSWKKRHRKRRMIDVHFAIRMRELLAPGATVDFRTDVPAYAREGEQTWLEAGFEKLPDERPEVLSTRERRYATGGQRVLRARFRNPEGNLRPIQTGRPGREWQGVRRRHEGAPRWRLVGFWDSRTRSWSSGPLRGRPSTSRCWRTGSGTACFRSSPTRRSWLPRWWSATNPRLPSSRSAGRRSSCSSSGSTTPGTPSR